MLQSQPNPPPPLLPPARAGKPILLPCSSKLIQGLFGLPGAAGVPGVKPVIIELTDVKTKEKVEELEVDACLVATGRAPYTHVCPPPPCLLDTTCLNTVLIQYVAPSKD